MRLESSSIEPGHTESRAEEARRLRQLDVLQRLTEAVHRTERLEAVYSEAIRGLESALGADRAAIILTDDDGVMRYKAWRNLSETYRNAMEGRSPWHRDTTDPRTIVISDVREHKDARPHRETLALEGILALIIVPLLDAGELLGRVVLYYDAAFDPDPQEVRLAETIARHVALAITRRRSWDELTRREAEFTALAERSPDIIARFDRELRYIYINPTVERATGRPREQFVGRTNRELGMPDQVVERWEEALRRVMDEGVENSIGFEIGTPNGPRYFEGRLVPERNAGGEVISVLATTRDLTERRRAEERLRFLTEAGAVLASSLDLRTTLDAVVRIAAEVLGDGCAIDVLREGGAIERLAVYTRDPQIGQLLEEMEQRYPSRITGTAGNVVALRTGEPQFYPEITEELVLAASTDEEHAELWRRIGLRAAICVPLIARGQRLGVVTVISTDPARVYSTSDLEVTIELARRAATAVDHAVLFEETRRARDEAQQANAAKASFLAVMSHELRTPLAAILGYAELVADEIVGPLNATQRDQLGRIKSSGTHLLMLIEELLSFARIETGHESLRLAEVDIGEIVTESAELVETLVQKKRLGFAIHLPGEPVSLVTDGVKVRQILLNLLGNAVKFTDAGAIQIVVARDGTGVRLDVEDSGIGIPAEHLEHVFDPFWQVEHVTTRRKGGTGLGLSVARQLARLLGGDILVASRVGEGSRFSVLLPSSLPPADVEE